MDALRRLVQVVGEGGCCVLATVVAGRGSVPRGPGARMLVAADGTCSGTVGGGEIEDAVLARARDLLGRPGAGPTTVEVEARCGGLVTVLLERFGPPRSLVVVGAGHVGTAVAQAAARAGFAVTLLGRSRTGELDGAPQITMKDTEDPAALAQVPHPGESQLIVATGSQDADVAWAVAGLRAGFAGVGVVGSRAKAVAVQEGARAAGLPPEHTARLRCPVGLDLGAVTPGEIALAIVAELLLLARRGEVPEGWRKRSRG
jgi:xanthine dehydrogenase accessory factor